MTSAPSPLQTALTDAAAALERAADAAKGSPPTTDATTQRLATRCFLKAAAIVEHTPRPAPDPAPGSIGALIELQTANRRETTGARAA